MQYREKKNNLLKNQVPCKFVHTMDTHTTSSLPLNFKGTALKLLIQLAVTEHEYRPSSYV